MLKLTSNLFFLFAFSLSNQAYSISYDHENFVLSPNPGNSFALPPKIKQIAFNSNSFLNNSSFFDTKLIVDTPKVREEFKKDQTHKEVIIETEDKEKLVCSYFDRKSDKIIIVGPGFTNCKEKMAPFVHMFADYDILLMNFRGHGHRDGINLNPFYNLLEITFDIQLGVKEEKDVFAVTDFVRKQKKYKQVTGLGICFGAIVFAKAQGIAQGKNINCFDKIILDGCWLSLVKFIEKLRKDPCLILDPQRGGASDQVRWLFKRDIVFYSIINSMQSGLKIDFEQIDVQKYLNNIKTTPILLFYGKDDLTIARSEFENVWNSMPGLNKLGIITSNPHVHNHLKSKELYKLICELFIEEDISKVFALLHDPELMNAHVIEKFKNRLLLPIQNFAKPNKVVRNQSLLDYISAYKLVLLCAGALYGGYKYGKISSSSIAKLAKVYAACQLFSFGWRPAITVLSKFME